MNARDEEVADLYARLEALTAENERMRAVLTPSEENVEAVALAMFADDDTGADDGDGWRPIEWGDAFAARDVYLSNARAVLRALSERAGIK